MMQYNLTNPSDPYTFEAPDLECAALVAVLLGKGYYGADPREGDEGVPIFLFVGSDEWFAKKFGRSPEQSYEHVTQTRLHDLIAALDSVLIGNFADRAEVAEAAARMSLEDGIA